MDNHKIGLITDSTSDIPPELVEKYNIAIIPQHIIWGTQELLDQVQITPAEFYRRLPVDPVHPKTSQPTPHDFLTLINQLREQGASEVVIITISNQLSGTFQSARAAAEAADIPVTVHDAMSVSMGLGWQVLAAAEVREQGGDAAAMVAAAKRVQQTVRVYFSVDTLDYLHKGGRIGGAARLVGTALQLKPLLAVDTTTGRVESVERTRTRAKAIQVMYKTFFEQMAPGRPLHMTVLHSDRLAEAEEIAARVRAEFNPRRLYVTQISPVLGVHAGPGALGLIGYTD